MLEFNKLESFVLKVSRILGMFFMLVLVLGLGWNVLSFVYSKVKPIFNQKYPKLEYHLGDFKKASVNNSNSNGSENGQVVKTRTDKLTEEILASLKTDYENTIARLVQAKGISLVRGQIGEELRARPYAELEQSVDAVIADTTPKYWQIFYEKSYPKIKSDLENNFYEEDFQEDFAETLVEYLKESVKNKYSPYGLYNYQEEEYDFITDMRASKVYKHFLEAYTRERSDLASKNQAEDFFTQTRLIFLAAVMLLLPFLGVLFAIMRIEKHLEKRE